MKIANEHDTLEGQIIVDLEMDDLLNKLEVYLFKSIDLLSRFNYKFLIIERR
jgi:hypothetical protein